MSAMNTAATPTIATENTDAPAPNVPGGVPCASPGARLAALSRAAQGLGPVVVDSVVLAALRDLCSAPRSPSRVAA
jgi:hypothetical protein